MTQILNSALKVKTGTLKDNQDIHLTVPEAGGLLLNKNDLGLYYADGLNWLKVPTESEAMAVRRSVPLVTPRVAGVSQQILWFDEVIYNHGSAFTLDTGAATITINTSGIYVLNGKFTFASSVAQNKLELSVLYPLLELFQKDVRCEAAGVSYFSDSLTYVTLTAGDVLTGYLKAVDFDCDATFDSRFGLAFVSP